jgi:hypothetical protein
MESIEYFVITKDQMVRRACAVSSAHVVQRQRSGEFNGFHGEAGADVEQLRVANLFLIDRIVAGEIRDNHPQQTVCLSAQTVKFDHLGNLQNNRVESFKLLPVVSTGFDEGEHGDADV